MLDAVAEADHRLVRVPGERSGTLGALVSALRLARPARFVVEPADAIYEIGSRCRRSFAMWHGQHFLTPFIKDAKRHRAKVLISRHRDGEINAARRREARHRHHPRLRRAQRRISPTRAASVAFNAMLDALREGYNVAMTADVPEGRARRRARHRQARAACPAGRSIRSRSRPSRRIVLDNWDRTTINLPFGRGRASCAASRSVCRAKPTTPRSKTRRKQVEDALNAADRRAPTSWPTESRRRRAVS